MAADLKCFFLPLSRMGERRLFSIKMIASSSLAPPPPPLTSEANGAKKSRAEPTGEEKRRREDDEVDAPPPPNPHTPPAPVLGIPYIKSAMRALACMLR